MKKFMLTIWFLFFCFVFLSSQVKKGERIELTLNECIVKALENNLDISVETYNPEISEASISQAKNEFLPRLTLDYNNSSQKLLTSLWTEGTEYTTKSNDFNIALSKKIITGGDINLRLFNSTTDTTRSFSLINPYYSSLLSLDFTQPLLRNFGPKTSKKDIKIAQNLRDISVYELKSDLIQKVYDVENAYWYLVYAIENLRVSELSLQKNKEQLKKFREAAKMGIKYASDVLNLETEVARGEDSVLSARSQVENNERKLRRIVHLPEDALGVSKLIFPIDKPTAEKKEITFEEALTIALENRPEIARSQKEIENRNINVSYSKNQLLPQLDLKVSYWFPEQSGDFLIYKNNDPLTGIVIDKIKGSRADSLKDVFKLNNDNWRVSLTLTLPLENIFSRASLAQAMMERERNLVEIERQKKSIYYDVLDVLNTMKNNEKRIESSTRSRKKMEERLKAEEQKYQLGLTAMNWILDFQRDLALAKAEEIRAIIDYKISVAELERVLGINLKTKNIKFKNYEF